jgi:hypothetical protein
MAAVLPFARRLRPLEAFKDYIADIMQYIVMMASK